MIISTGHRAQASPAAASAEARLRAPG